MDKARSRARIRGLTAAFVAAWVLMGSWHVPVAAQEPERFFVVGFRVMPRGLELGDQLHGGRVTLVDRVLHFARVATRSPAAFKDRARDDGRVRYVEPDPEVKWIEFTPNDPSFGSQYGPQHVRAPEAWDTTLGDLDAKVCIVDTGVRYTHEDIAGARWLGGRDVYNGDNDPVDDNGHGTHVAGIAAATINNAKGIAGVANVGIFGVKVLSSLGFGSNSQVAQGIRWCADNAGPGTVISMSLGGGASTVVQDAVSYAYANGNLLVAAAGNDGPCSNCISYPAKYSQVIAVTCTTSSKTQCSFSSDGPESELAAPGSNILSTYNTSDTAYTSLSGTSMSTPHVSGVAALVWSQFPALSNTDLRGLLDGNAQDLGTAGWDELYGHGLVDAKATLDAAGQPPVPETTVSFENFDDGVADGWTLTGLWHVSSACSVPPSPPNHLGYNEDSDCEYSTGTSNSGTAAFAVDLAGKTAATLKFDHRFEKEIYSGGAYDVMRVQASTDGGATWTTLRQWDSRNPNQLAWAAYSVDLDAYVGRSVRLRFSFDTVDNKFNNFDGWFLDNVEVTAGSPGGNQPPMANAGPDQTVADDDASGNEAVTLNGTGSSDSDGTIESYEWREGGTLIATGVTPAVTFAVGAHTVTLTVTDDGGATDTDDVVVTVNANQPPTAAFTHSTSDLSVNVNGSGSSDPDGTITSYSWDWGDGSPSGSGVTANHTYAAAGTYTITLTVTDNGGAADTEARSVVAGQTTLVSENFDDGVANGWVLSGLWHVSSACTAPASAPNHLGYNEDSDCEYSTGARTTGSATFDADLTGLSQAALAFTHRWETESYSKPYDIMRVQVSSDGGTTWTTLKQWDSRDPNQLAWAGYTVDLDAYAGQAVKLRFFFDSIDNLHNTFDGWFLDDVEVTSP